MDNDANEPDSVSYESSPINRTRFLLKCLFVLVLVETFHVANCVVCFCLVMGVLAGNEASGV